MAQRSMEDQVFVGENDIEKKSHETIASGSDGSEPNLSAGVVPRWRMRIENDSFYHYCQLREASLMLLHEIYKKPCTKSPSQLMAQLYDENFEGWSLEWERKQTTLCLNNKLSAQDLHHAFLDILPYGVSRALLSLVAYPQIYINKRTKRDVQDSLQNGPNVYEVSDIRNSIFLRLFQTSKQRFWKRGNVSYIGKDTAGKAVLRLVWTTSIFPSRRCIKVYCPPSCHIGSIYEKWSMKQGYIVTIVTPDPVQSLQGKITLRKIATQRSWLVSDTNLFFDVKLYDNDQVGQIHGDWPRTCLEPVLGIIFPLFPIGLITKVMILASSLLVFERSFKERLRGMILPMSQEFDEEMRRIENNKRRFRRLTNVQ